MYSESSDDDVDKATDNDYNGGDKSSPEGLCIAFHKELPAPNLYLSCSFTNFSKSDCTRTCTSE